MTLLLQINLEATAFKYGHPGLRQLAHRLAYGKISEHVHPHKRRHDTLAIYHGRPELKTTWTDTMLILACELVRIGIIFCANAYCLPSLCRFLSSSAMSLVLVSPRIRRGGTFAR